MNGDDRSAVLMRYRLVGHLQVPTGQTARPSVLLISKHSVRSRFTSVRQDRDCRTR